MKTKSLKTCYILLISVLAVVMACMSVLFLSANREFAFAAGNIAAPPDGLYDISLNLDVNGADATSAIEDSVNKVSEANNQSYRKRQITVTALLQHYATIANGVTSADASAYNSSNYTISTDSSVGIYNSFDAYVNLSKVTSASRVTAITFEALQYKTSPKAYAALEFTKVTSAPANLPATVFVYIDFTLQSTFVPITSRDYIQNVNTDDKTLYLAGDSDNTADRIELKNKSETKFDLSGLVGETLQYKNTEGTLVNIKEGIDTGRDWVLNDVNFFNVTANGIGEVVGSENIRISVSSATDSTRTAPKIIIIPVLTENLVNKFSQKDSVTGEVYNFWDAKHYLRFTLRDLSGSQSVTISKRVYFASANAPITKSSYEMPTLLNATSAYQFTSSGKYLNKDDKTSEEQNVILDVANMGYAQVRVKPSYLCDFPSKGTQYFNPVATVGDGITLSVDNIVTLEVVYKKNEAGADTNEVDYYLISAVNNGSVEVTFPIRYTTSSAADAQPSAIDVTVSFKVYGKFSITPLTMKGKKVSSYSTVTSDYFKPFVDEDFYVTAVSHADEQSKEKVQVEFKNNQISLTPLASGEAVLRLEFQSLKNESVFVDWTVSINYEGGSFLATWETVYVVLFFIGIGIAVLGIILLFVWIFIRSLSKRREEENATSAPTSAYIIKLNSTIAAVQAQQRLATTQAFSAAQTQMLALGAGPTSTGAPAPNTLQLGAAPASMPGNGGTMSMPPEINNININMSQPSPTEEIYIPLSDDELLERIFVEKYEPRGMARRSFFKSKDLQSRELEKEKTRIRDDVRGGMTIEEACKSLSERQNAQSVTASTEQETAPIEEKSENIIINILGFDPDSPLVEQNEQITAVVTEDMSKEESDLKTTESRMERIEKELAALEERLRKTELEIDKAQKAVESTESTIQMKEESNISLKKTIEDLEFKLATAKSKDKDKLLKDIDNKEHVIAANKDIIVKLQDELSVKRGNLDTLNGILSKYSATKQTTSNDYENVKKELEEAKENYRVAQELLEKARKAQETKGKLERLRPMLEKVNVLDVEIRQLVNNIEKNTKEKDTIKADVSDLQKQMLNTNDVIIVNELSGKMSELNKQVSALDKSIAADNKNKADKTIVFNGERRKANEFIDKEVIEVDDVVKEEDDVISKMAFDEYMVKTQKERSDAEENLSALQAKYDELAGSYDTSVMDIAVKTAAQLKEAEDALAQTQAELDDINAKMETASDDDKLMLSIDQMSINEKFEQQQQQFNELQASATKEKIEYQMNYDKQLEETKKELEEAQQAYDAASKKVDESLNAVNPLDLILSGSGVISQDRQRLEAENLKKQLELSKSAMEQMKLQAKMAQMDAEKAIIDAQRASDASKQEAERLAQEAISKAEEAKAAAEQKAVEEAEKARLEIEKAKQEAEEQAEKARLEIEKAKQEAEEQAERARKEAEDAKLMAEQKAEQSKKEAEDALLAAEQKAAEEAERAKKAAEEEAERIRKEAEEEKRKAAEEAERIKKEAEEKAEKERLEKEAEEARIKEKVAQKKAKVLELRKEIKDVSNEATAKELREKFYTELINLDDDEKTSAELKDLINKSMDDATHAGEISVYKDLAHKEPKRVVKKVTERINRIPKKSGSRTGARADGSRPHSAARSSAGARPGAGSKTRSSASRTAARPDGTRPARPSTRSSAGARPTASKPRTTTSRPSGARPTRPGTPQKPKN